ncbi:hypothetical protein PN488_02925 [Nodularia spumigena CS-591/12]|jgi:hypothetical protein|uniref:hypothetical protein n=1 Tax=Nodularia spumigena TaxID=70799 RepID=UPI00232F8D27|nr:hypothetical protein [Nodularia spumigena]MDB9303341.1 hypothetical protein [Nodularia spumigena CS-591/12]
MSRRIIETQLQASKTPITVDNYFEKIMKYIPSEIIGGWIAIQGIAKNITTQNTIFLWGILVFLSILTFFYIKNQTSVAGKPPAIKQNLFSVGAFLIWALAIGGEPFESLSFYNSGYGVILMILYTLTIPVISLNHDQV